MPQSPLEEFVGSMTLSELAARSGKSVSQIIAWAQGSKSAPAPRATEKKAAATPKKVGRPANSGGSAPAAAKSSKAVNTRTPDGRAAYDEAVLGAVTDAKGPVGSSALRKLVGGTPLQLRTALNRLIEGGKVNYQGKARATRYSLR